MNINESTFTPLFFAMMLQRYNKYKRKASNTGYPEHFSFPKVSIRKIILYLCIYLFLKRPHYGEKERKEREESRQENE